MKHYNGDRAENATQVRLARARTTKQDMSKGEFFCLRRLFLFESIGLSSLSLGIALTLYANKAYAGWDLRHKWAIEDLLREYLKTLPGGPSINPPRLFIYEGTAYSRACPKSGISAPAYCPGDHTVYLETRLGDEMASTHGDFGALSILAHEFGHAYLFKRNMHPKGKDGELAVDAFAGRFARFVQDKGLLEPGDIDEARATFEALGDYQVYHHDHHGTPAERRQAFEDGYQLAFRLPGEDGARPTKPPPKAESPRPELPADPSPPTGRENSAAPAVLGLGVGVVLFAGLVAGVIAMIQRAREDD